MLVETGARLTESLLAAEVVDKVLLLQCPVEIGREGVPATTLGGIDGRLRGAGYAELGQELLGEDLLRTFGPAV